MGYEKRSFDDLIEILKINNVKKVLDIRSIPISRRKEFSKEFLEANLGKVGIEYVHLGLAGNPYHKYQNDFHLCLQLYSSYLDNHSEILDMVLGELSNCVTAILCYERKHSRCHRSVLLEFMSENAHELDIIRVD